MMDQTDNKKRNLIIAAVIAVLLVALLVVGFIMIKNRGSDADTGAGDAEKTTAVGETTVQPEDGIDIDDLLNGDDAVTDNTKETVSTDEASPDATLPGLNGDEMNGTDKPASSTKAPAQDTTEKVGLSGAAANTEEGYGPLF